MRHDGEKLKALQIETGSFVLTFKYQFIKDVIVCKLQTSESTTTTRQEVPNLVYRNVALSDASLLPLLKLL